MDVTDLDIRKPKGRKSRNNSGNSRDPKSENKKEANGNAEENETNQDSLPNGDERPLGSVKSDENVEDNGEEERSTPKAKPTSSDIVQCAKITVSNPKTNKSKAYLKRNSKIQPHNNSNDSEEEFMGFDSDGDLDSDSPLSVMMKLIDKYEKMQPVSNDEFSDEEEEYCQPSQEYSSDAYCSGASSPTKMDGLHDVLGIDEVCSSTASSPSVASGFSGDGRPRGKKSHHVDLANPAFRKPLEMGWRRELVFRKMSDNSNKRQADVYYYTPSGKKVRSAREVIEHLSGTDLTEENFTFFKVALGLNDPTKEIIRDAKVRESSGTPPQKIPKLSKALKPGGISKSREESASSPNITKNFSRGAFPRIKVTPGRGNQHSSPGRPRPVGRPKKDFLPIADGELEIGMLPPSWKEPSAVSGSRKMSGTPGGKVSGQAMGGKAVSKNTTGISGSYTASGSKRGPYDRLPCSIRCLSMMGVIPSLQCRLCLCLYHPECVGLGTITDVIHSYVCKKCQRSSKDGKSSSSKNSDNAKQGSKTTTAPPPLTPISSLGVEGAGSGVGGGVGTGQGAGEAGSPPKLQRLPRPGGEGQGTARLYTVPRYVKLTRPLPTAPPPPPPPPPPPQPGKAPSIVGAVTTWLPPSSTIQLGAGGGAGGGGPLGSGSRSAAVAVAAPADASAVDAGSTSPPPPTAGVQAIAHVAGKKYIVVPKHNVLSVSSAAKVADPAPPGEASRPGAGGGGGCPSPAVPAVVLPDAGAGGGRAGAAYVLGSPTGAQSGLLLVPVAPPPTAAAVTAPLAPVAYPEHAQYVLVNAHTGGVVFTNFPRAREDGYTGTSDGHFMQFFMQNVSVGYTALHHVFQYLKVHELLRAGRVCRMWHDLAGHPSLWRTVRMKNSQVLDWDGCADTLSTHGTRHLDLRKMLLDTSKSKEVWNQFCTAIGRISSLRHLDLCRCPTSVVERVAAKCPQLTNLTALFLSDPNLDLKSLKSLTQLEELRLKGVNGLKLKSSLDVLKDMTSLKHLSLTMVKDLGKSCPENLKSLTQLESLELGECNDVSEAFGTECLPRLKKLTRLRLEMGQMKCPTFVILDGVHSLPSLTHLELVNFDIKPGFDKALAQCTNIKRLLLIPTYLTQSATTNHMVLGGVTKLSDNLVQFVWGVTHELLHVTELFVDQCEGQKGVPKGPPGGPNPLQPPSGKKPGDSIPILRPVPGRDILGAGDVKLEEDDTSKPSPQVDILPLSRLQKLLSTSLPKTNVNILKIPFSATWRQTLGETGH